jgi:hypothetical protein
MIDPKPSGSGWPSGWPSAGTSERRPGAARSSGCRGTCSCPASPRTPRTGGPRRRRRQPRAAGGVAACGLRSRPFVGHRARPRDRRPDQLRHHALDRAGAAGAPRPSARPPGAGGGHRQRLPHGSALRARRFRQRDHDRHRRRGGAAGPAAAGPDRLSSPPRLRRRFRGPRRPRTVRSRAGHGRPGAGAEGVGGADPAGRDRGGHPAHDDRPARAWPGRLRPGTGFGFMAMRGHAPLHLPESRARALVQGEGEERTPGVELPAMLRGERIPGFWAWPGSR